MMLIFIVRAWTIARQWLSGDLCSYECTIILIIFYVLKIKLVRHEKDSYKWAVDLFDAHTYLDMILLFCLTVHLSCLGYQRTVHTDWQAEAP